MFQGKLHILQVFPYDGCCTGVEQLSVNLSHATIFHMKPPLAICSVATTLKSPPQQEPSGDRQDPLPLCQLMRGGVAAGDAGRIPRQTPAVLLQTGGARDTCPSRALRGPRGRSGRAPPGDCGDAPAPGSAPARPAGWPVAAARLRRPSAGHMSTTVRSELTVRGQNRKGLRELENEIFHRKSRSCAIP